MRREWRLHRESVPMGQLAAWICTALIPALLQLAAGVGWLAAIAVGVVCHCAVWAAIKWGKRVDKHLPCLLEYLYIVILLCSLLPWSAKCWPGDNDPVVPLILLALAAWSTQKGAQAAARVGCVLFWVVLGIYLTVLALGTGEVRPAWLKPAAATMPWPAAVLLLVPAGAARWLRNGEGWQRKLWIPSAFLILGAVVVAGVLSTGLAGRIEDPMYMAVQSLAIPGVMQRFEALVSAGMTVGWFALLTLLLSMAAAALEVLKPAWGRRSVWVTAAIAGMGLLCKMHITWHVAVILATVFWVAIPILTQGLDRQKKM